MAEARDILNRFECREQCAEKGEPPCFEIDEDRDGVKYAPCDLCIRLTEARLAALSAEGLEIVPRYATQAMLAHVTDMAELNGDYITFPDAWLAMVIAASTPPRAEKEKE